MAKKENNRKNYAARENWMRDKRNGRPKQTWVTVNNGITFTPQHG